MTYVTMWDSVDALDVSGLGVTAVAGYMDGHWPSYAGMVSLNPRLRALSITVTGAVGAHVADVERGDLTFESVARWIKASQRAGFHRPAVYVSLLTGRAMVEFLELAGCRRADYRLWLAHWTGRAHICGPDCGWRGMPPGATQYRSGFTRYNVDVSLASASWIDALRRDLDRAGGM